MKTLNYFSKLTLAALVGISVTVTSCKKQEGCTDPTSLNYDADAEVDDGSCTYDTDKDVPTTYTFDNINYKGQVVRILLLKDLVTKIEDAKTTPGSVTSADLLAIYENTAGLYTSISTGKKLSDKCEADADVQVRSWFSQIETLSTTGKGYTTDDSLDLKQLVEKTLMGSVLFYQAADKYLANISSQDNNTVTPGEGTKMEHNWDEAFGYFGAARDYNNYTDDEIKGDGTKDSNGDGSIDQLSEQCFYFSQTAAKRDAGTSAFTTSSQTNYTKAIFDAWLAGRTAIVNKNYSSRDTYKASVLLNWEKIIAATVLHYINEVKGDIATSGADFPKHWGELKGYYGMLQYYSSNKMGSQFATVDALIGSKPSATSVANLDSAAETIKQVYGFTDEQKTGW